MHANLTPSITHTSVLTCHPSNVADAVHGIDTQLHWTAIGALALTYRLTGNIHQLRIEPLRPQRRADQLWQHTCFEAFVGEMDGPAYFEFNFSPSREWAAYAFRSYRDGKPIENDALDPKIALRETIESFELDAAIRLDRLPAMKPSAKLRLGLSAVIENRDGGLSYWALKHPAGKPDFHHPDSFALELSLAGQPA